MATNVLSKDEDFYVLIKDKSGNIIFPQNPESLKNINALLKYRENEENTFFCENINQWFDFSEKEMLENGENLTIVSITNVTKYQNNIKSLSIDPVTNIPSRRTTRNLINAYLKEAIKNEETFAVIMADLDNFKGINDNYGHFIGDLLLKSVAEVFQKNTRQHTDEVHSKRPSDIIGRFGGDEFVILLKGIDEEDAVSRVESIKDAVRNVKIDINGEVVAKSTMSFGLAFADKELLEKFQDSEADSLRTEILRRSDIALYESKENGKNQVTKYSSELEIGNQKNQKQI